jgi:predicted O-linked N-acetylglucosamine transferase (SPINDLY family)
MKSGLRERIRRSVLMDEERFVRALEESYRWMYNSVASS